MYTITTYYHIDDALYTKWQKLWNSAEDAHCFNSPEWFVTVCDVYEIKNIVIITIEEKNNMVLILPLVRQSRFGITTLASAGGKFIGKSSLLYKFLTEEMVDVLLDNLVKQGNFYLQELSEEIATFFFNRHAQLIKREASINPYLPLIPDPFLFLSRKNKSQIRGIIRRHGTALHYKTFVGDFDALETVFLIDRKSTKKKQGKATFVTQQDKQFFRELVRRMRSHIMIDIIYYNRVPVAYGIGFVYKKIYYAALTAYDGRFRFLRPGKLLAKHLLKSLQKKGLTFIDFGRGNSPLKQEFTKIAHTQYDIFYIESLLSKHWLLSTQKVYESVLHSKHLYNFYLFSRKTLSH